MEGTGRSTVKVLLFLTLLGGIHSQAANYSIKDCGSGTITFKEDTQPTLECTGMNSSQNIFWSVNDTDNEEVRIGDCYVNNTCSAVTNNDYELTRTSHGLSVLKIKGNIRQKDRHTIKCSQGNNARKAICKLIMSYTIKDCGSGTIRFYEETQPTLKCTGMTQHHNIYWSVNDTEGNEVRIGDCNKTNTNTNTCYGVTDSDYELTRPAHNESVLKIKGNIRQKDGYIMECSQRNNDRKAFCRLKIISYTIPICESGNITFREGEVTTLQCVGMHGLHNMYWSVYDEDGEEVRIGDCNTTRHCTSITSNDFSVTRPRDEMSELTIQGNYREKAGKTIKCSQLLNQTEAFCKLSVIFLFADSSESFQEFPTTAIAGGVGAALVIIVVIIVVLVIISRRKKRDAADQSLPNNRDGEDFVEMHVNDVYGLGDTTDDDPNQVEASTKPMAAACRVPPTSTVTEPGKPAMVQHVFVTSNGGTPYMNVQQHAGVTGEDDQYAVIAEEHTEGPKGDVYTVVHKTHKKQEAPERDVPLQVASEQTVSPREGSGQGETNVSSPSGDVYGHADKSSKGANADHNSEKETDEKKNREQPNVDPKASKPITKLRTTMETEPSLARDGTAFASDQDRPGMRAVGESYENVTMSSSELPSLATPDVTKTTDVDDEYNTLMLAARTPAESDEPNPEYSHIGAV